MEPLEDVAQLEEGGHWTVGQPSCSPSSLLYSLLPKFLLLWMEPKATLLSLPLSCKLKMNPSFLQQLLPGHVSVMRKESNTFS